MPSGGQRFFVSADISGNPNDGREIKMGLPLNGVKTLYSSPGPSDAPVINAYAQKIDYANPDTAVITSPPAGAVVSGQVTLRADASDTVQVGKVEFYNGLPGGGTPPVATDDNGAPWEATWDCRGLPAGSCTIYARVYDRTYLRPSGSPKINHYKDSSGVPITVGIPFSVQLVSGWNLISIPVKAFNENISSVFSRLMVSRKSGLTMRSDQNG